MQKFYIITLGWVNMLKIEKKKNFKYRVVGHKLLGGNCR